MLSSFQEWYETRRKNYRKNARLNVIRNARKDFLKLPVKEYQETDNRIYNALLQRLYNCSISKIPPYDGRSIRYNYLLNGNEKCTEFKVDEIWTRIYNFFDIACKTRETCKICLCRIEKTINWAWLKQRNLFKFPYENGTFEDAWSVLPTDKQNARLLRMYPKSSRLVTDIEMIMILTRFGIISKDFLHLPSRELYMAIHFCIKSGKVPDSLEYLENQFNDPDRVKVDLHNYIVNLQATIPEEWITLFQYNEEYPGEDNRLMLFMSKGYFLLDEIKNILEKHLQQNKFRKIGE